MIAVGILFAAGSLAEAQAKAAAMAEAFDAMTASATMFDGSYELARARFNALAGKEAIAA